MSATSAFAPVSLLCLPCAGASATMYLRWRRLLPSWVRLVAVELPGRGARMGEPLVRDFNEQVQRLCDEQQQALQGRYALFGHSMGALLAHGIARRQHVLARPAPGALFVSASPAPARRDPARFAGLDNRQALLDDMRRQGGTPAEVFDNEELLGLTLSVLSADYQVCASFRPEVGPPLDMPVQAFGGRHDDIAPDALEAWREATSAPSTVHWFDGGHFYLRGHEPMVLKHLVQGLSEAFPDVAGLARPAA